MTNFKNKPKKFAFVSKNEIWICKNTYIDQFNNTFSSEINHCVLIKTDKKKILKDFYVRVQPISFNINHRTDEDVLVNDITIIGDPFIIETWNELPILIDMLEKKIGEITFELDKPIEPDDYSEDQLAFRNAELQNTAFLKQSILSLLAWNEQKQNGRIISFKFTNIIAYAAVIIGLAIFFLQPWKLDSESYFNKYAYVYPIQSELFIDSGEKVRGTDCKMDGFTSSECEIIELALKRYIEKDFLSCEELFLSIQDLRIRNKNLFFYLGVSSLYSNKIQESIEIFEYLISDQKSELFSDALYYLALSYVKDGNYREARRILKQLEQNDKTYLNQKGKVLKDLKWF